MGSAGRPLQALQALSDMGVRIAIDDFGTGYSNLAYLSRLPVSVLKLDGSFVRGFRYDDGAHPNPADETIVEAMVQLAHRLGLTVTAECVETAGQAERLRRIGCDTGPGLALLASGGAGAHRGTDRRQIACTTEHACEPSPPGDRGRCQPARQNQARPAIEGTCQPARRLRTEPSGGRTRTALSHAARTHPRSGRNCAAAPHRRARWQ